MKIKMAIMTVLLSASPAFCADQVSVLGRWNDTGRDALLEIYQCGEKICGKIVWLKNPEYIDSKDGPVGKAKVDRKNPNPALRNRPILGLKVMSELTSQGNNKWGNGVCYDPETGKTYKCQMTLESPNRLTLRGYIGFSILGRNYFLTR